MMQVIRDLVTLPAGRTKRSTTFSTRVSRRHPHHEPRWSVAGRRRTKNRFDLNRDLLVQSQPEIRANTAFQLEWLAPVGLFMHGYYNPTLVDGLTKPHNPGLEYDKFLYWNQRRLDANQAAIEAIGRTIQRPVNQWDERGVSGSKNGGPAVAEGWDDWGPFYSQTYGAFFGVDGSTVEMCDDAACGRLGSKREQYVIFYSSARFWLENRERHPGRSAGDLPARSHRRSPAQLLRRPPGRGPRVHGGAAQLDGRVPNGVPHPVRRRVGRPGLPGSRRPAERRGGRTARPLAARQRRRGTPGRRRHRLERDDAGLRRPDAAGLPRLCLHRIGGRAGYLRADQSALRAAGRLGTRIGSGARMIVEIPAGDASFNPATTPLDGLNPLQGGVRDGPADWYTLTVRGTAELRAALEVLEAGSTAKSPRLRSRVSLPARCRPAR